MGLARALNNHDPLAPAEPDSAIALKMREKHLPGLAKQPCKSTAIYEHCHPENRLKRLFFGFMAEHFLRQYGAGPASDKSENMQSAFGDPAAIIPGREFIEAVSNEGNQAGCAVKAGHVIRKFADHGQDNDKAEKKQGKNKTHGYFVWSKECA